MRVIAGSLRHRKLEYPENNKEIRPTKDRIREAFFSSLGDISNKSFLDLYAGSGSMGIEAISRGASKSYFVDISKEATSIVKRNLVSLNIEDKSEVLLKQDNSALIDFANRGLKFDIIYLDPPYESDRYEVIIPLIYQLDILSSNGILAIEANRKINLDNIPTSKLKEYHYGEISVLVIRN